MRFALALALLLALPTAACQVPGRSPARPFICKSVGQALPELERRRITDLTWFGPDLQRMAKSFEPREDLEIVWMSEIPAEASGSGGSATMVFGPGTGSGGGGIMEMPELVLVPDFFPDVTPAAAEAHANDLGLDIAFFVESTLDGGGYEPLTITTGHEVQKNHPDNEAGTYVEAGSTVGVVLVFQRSPPG